MGKILCCAEKPSVAKEIADTLGCTNKKDGYFEGETYIVTWAIGHLIGLKNPEEHDERYKNWTLDDLPLHFPLSNSLKVLPDTARQFKIVKSLINSKEISSLVCCGDCAREGILIQSWIYRMAGNRKPVKVLWISSFTREAILEGFKNLHDESEYHSLLEEAEARAEVDWIFGMNYSRAMTLLYGSNRQVLSYGRCQTPLLNLLVSREKDIRDFKPVPFYNIEADFVAEEGKYKGILVNEQLKTLNMASKDDAKLICEQLENSKGEIKSYRSAQKSKAAPLLFDIGSLQSTAGSRYGYTAEQTLAIAQSLYEKHKILSYPRTDSKYLTSDLMASIHINLQKCCFGEFAPIVNNIKKNGWQIGKAYCNDKKVADHPALIPTTADIEKVYPNLTKEEKNIFDLVVKRFLAIYYPPYLYEATEIQTDLKGYTFLSRGIVPLSMGYKEIYNDSDDKEDKKDTKKEECLLPKVSKGDTVTSNGIEVLDKQTQCPKRYTAGSIITLMEKYGIGTAATRASIIGRLEKRGFISLQRGKYFASSIGEAYIEVVPEELKDPQLTNQTEIKLSAINARTLSKDEFISENIKAVEEQINKLKKQKNDHGSIVKDAIAKESSVANCPICKEGKIIPRKTKDGRVFYGCTRYKEGCKFAFNQIMYGRKFSEKEASYLCNCVKKGCATPILKGFVSKEGKNYEAGLKWDSDKNAFVLFFDNNKKRKAV